MGVASLALQFTASIGSAYALVALWLLALGAAALVGTPGRVGPSARVASLCGAALLTGAGLLWSVRGGGVLAVLMVIVGWAALTALASGVVRSLRLSRVAVPVPPIAAAAAGALEHRLPLSFRLTLHGLARFPRQVCAGNGMTLGFT